MRFKGAQIVKRILLEKNSIKKVLKINEFHTSNYATNHLHSVFNTKKTFHSEYKRCSFDDLSIFEISALQKFNIIIQDNVKSSANGSERCASSLINIDKHIPVVQSKQLKQLCEDYDKIFSKHENDLSFYDKTQFDICTGDHKPIKNRPYRVPYAQQETVNKMIDDMLNHKIISKSNSPWASPVVIV